jgi:hypothetical protein
MFVLCFTGNRLIVSPLADLSARGISGAEKIRRSGKREFREPDRRALKLAPCLPGAPP